jgi:hypothetical protein
MPHERTGAIEVCLLLESAGSGAEAADFAVNLATVRHEISPAA